MNRGASQAGDTSAAAMSQEGGRASIRVGIDARLRAYRGGGIAEHVTRLIQGLRRLGWGSGEEPGIDLRVFEHRKRRSGNERRPSAGQSFLWTPPHHWLEGLALPVELGLRGGVDLLHCPDVVIPWGWWGRAVATVHDVAFLRRPELLTEESKRYYGQVHRSVRRARRVITVSEYTKRELTALTRVDESKVVVVPNAVAPRYLDGPPPKEGATRAADRAVLDSLGIGGPYLLFVSTIEPRKNVPLLLEAFKGLVEAGKATWRGQELSLVLAGGDGWKSEAVYRRAKELNLGTRVSWLGWVDETDLPALYREALMLAHPALDEGFGLTPLEAMACGTPVVVSRAGSLPEVVGEAGLMVDPTDREGWTAAMGRLLTDGALRSSLADQGRERSVEFTVERQARETLAVYRAAARP